MVPQIARLGPTLERLRGGDAWWLALGVLLEAISLFGEIARINTLPLPGGIGGVEGGIIGSFLVMGVNASVAVLAVLAYRTISYWLPTVPGVIAYVRLRRQISAHGGERAAGDARAGATAAVSAS